MEYTTTIGDHYDISEFLPEDQKIYQWLVNESERCATSQDFNKRTGTAIKIRTEQLNHQHWKHHPLYKIQQDLLGLLQINDREQQIQTIDDLSL